MIFYLILKSIIYIAGHCIGRFYWRIVHPLPANASDLAPLLHNGAREAL